MSTTAKTIDQAKLDEFMRRFVGDLGALILGVAVALAP
jgi:hypothetical protein